jgi:SAM-dependent methyltransferase
MAERDGMIRTRERPACPICNSTGTSLYSGLKDFCFAAPGEWNFRKCSGSDCGLVWIDPAPTEEDIGKAYQTYYTHNQPEPGAKPVRTVSWAIWHSYLGARFGYTQGTGSKWLRILAPLALLHPGGRDELDAAAMHLPAPNHRAHLLEVGSGSGVSLARMQALGWEAEGVEVDPAAVKAATARGVKVYLGEIAKQAFRENSFDAIYSSHVIEHLHDPAAVLKECYRILKPGGKLVVLTPNIESLGHRWYGSAWVGLDPPRHLSLFSRAALKRAAEQAGFAIQRLESSVRIAWVCGAMSYEIKRTGRCDVGHLNNPVALIRGFTYQLRERWAKRRHPLAGDELRLIATK